MRFLFGLSFLLSSLSSVSAQRQLTYSLGNGGGTGQSSTAPSLSANASVQYSSESVTVAYGGITVSGASSVPIVDPGGAQGQLGEYGSSYDTYTITTASGAPGTVRFTFHLSGTMAGSAFGQGGFQSQYEARVEGSSLSLNLFNGSLSSIQGLTGTQPSDHQSFTGSGRFTSGDPFGVSMILSHSGSVDATNSQATPPGGGQYGTTIFLQSAGFTVVDDQGDSLDFTAESASGTARGLNLPAAADYSSFTVTNQAAGRFGSTLSLLDGTASAATSVTAAFVAPPPAIQIRPVSDVADLNGTSSDPVVVQISYDPVAAQSIFGSALYLELAWFQNSTGTWKNAVLGNSGSTTPTFFTRAYNPATDFHLGNFGLDTANHVVWAVVNHNSQFVVTVPPPVLAVNSVSRSAQGVFHLNCTGEPARVNRIESSADLVTWTTLASVQADGAGAFQFDDSAATGRKKFYRVTYP